MTSKIKNRPATFLSASFVRYLLLVLLFTVWGCSGYRGDEEQVVEGPPDPDSDPQLTFWSSLEELCGHAFEGQVTESVPPDPALENVPVIMHVRSCDLAEIRIPFHVGDDRSRTWVVTPTSVGLRLASTVPGAIQPAARPITSMMQQEPSSVAMLRTSAPTSITVVALYLITLPKPGV